MELEREAGAFFSLVVTFVSNVSKIEEACGSRFVHYIP